MSALGEQQLTRRQLMWPMLCVFAFFMAFSCLRMPVPAPNEPHYLAKAKHYWDASFCPGDFFLDSADTHLVFYQTFGWVTRFLTLPQTAIVGRIVSLLLLACGWTVFTARLLPGRWGGVWAAAVFLAIEAVGNFSGEWIVGGVEAKVFAYAFVFLGLAALFDCGSVLSAANNQESRVVRETCRTGTPARPDSTVDRDGQECPSYIDCGHRPLCALWLGLAVSFHPVVGIWAVAAAMFSGLVMWLVNRISRGESLNHNAQSVPLTQLLLAAVVFVLASLPGLIPALEVVGKAPKKVQETADLIVVSYRLRHHLDPMEFSQRQYIEYAVLLLAWIGLELGWRRGDRAARWFRWFVAGSLLIAVAGFAIGVSERPFERYEPRMALMKFYPFRLADVFVPVGCAIALVRLTYAQEARLIETRFFEKTGFLRWANRPFLGWLICVGGIAFALLYPAPPAEHNSSRMKPGKRADWVTACRWIDENTPPTALFYTPSYSWAFKWHAQRAEFVSVKDCPQDAAGVVEWNRRLVYRRKWSAKHFDRGYSAAALRELQQETGVTHILASKRMNVPLDAIYENTYFSVYRMNDLQGVD